jgi:chemotaxis protein CheD
MNKRPAPVVLSRAAAADQRVHIIQGEFHVTDNPDVVITTLLGSCVSACLRDPQANVGGMNHFLLPGPDEASGVQEAERYGVHLMELLVNGLLRRGAARERLEAKLFGGARTMAGLSDIGARNASFAERFLQNEGIRLIGGSLRGELGRRIQFWPVNGRARQIYLKAEETPRPQTIPQPAGDVELF